MFQHRINEKDISNKQIGIHAIFQKIFLHLKSQNEYQDQDRSYQEQEWGKNKTQNYSSPDKNNHLS